MMSCGRQVGVSHGPLGRTGFSGGTGVPSGAGGATARPRSSDSSVKNWGSRSARGHQALRAYLRGRGLPGAGGRQSSALPLGSVVCGLLIRVRAPLRSLIRPRPFDIVPTWQGSRNRSTSIPTRFGSEGVGKLRRNPVSFYVDMVWREREWRIVTDESLWVYVALSHGGLARSHHRPRACPVCESRCEVRP